VEQKVSFVKELQRFWGISEEISLDNESILVPAHSFNIYKIK
jgi:hypothetical protein